MRTISVYRLTRDDRPSWHRHRFQGIRGPVRFFRLWRVLIVLWP